MGISSLDQLWRRLPAPRTWSVPARRAFALLLPVAVPLWFVLLAALALLVLARGLWRPMAEFWSAPPTRPRSSRSGYGRTGSSARTR